MTRMVFIHGLGQHNDSWQTMPAYFIDRDSCHCPELKNLLNGKEATYSHLYSSLVAYCENISGKIDLCGLSLGGILALNYAADHPQKVRSLVLIGTPYKVSRTALELQTWLFCFMPQSFFEKTAFDKNDTFALMKSMKHLDLTKDIQNIKSPSLIICGEKDYPNIKSSLYLSAKIERSKLKIIKAAGHALNEEKPRLLAQTMIDFYQKNDQIDW